MIAAEDNRTAKTRKEDKEEKKAQQNTHTHTHTHTHDTKPPKDNKKRRSPTVCTVMKNA